MTTPINDGGPAFSRSSQGSAGDLDMHPGMTLRDYFAAKAMQGMGASEHWSQNFDDNESNTHWRLAVAKAAYLMSDAMLAARGTTVQAQPFNEAKEREGFERAYLEAAGNYFVPIPVFGRRSDSDGEYLDLNIELAWQAWCAAKKGGVE